MTVQIRPAMAADAGHCAAILSAFFDVTDWLPRLHSAAEDRAFLTGLIAQNQVTVAAQHGGVVGYLARDGQALRHLYVSQDSRGQGIGAALLHYAMGQVDTLVSWCFQANLDAQRFYKRHGFVVTGMTDGAGNEERLPDIRYEWSAQ